MTMKQVDPTQHLSDELMIHVLSFVGGQLMDAAYLREDRCLDVLDAGRFYFSVAPVSHRWKKILDAAMPHLASNISIDCDLSLKQALSCMKWLGDHKLQLRRVLSAGTHDALTVDHPLILKLLHKCDTSYLKELNFCVDRLCHNPDRSQLLIEIGKQCPNLEVACITYRCATDFLPAASSSFSWPSLKTLRLRLDVQHRPRPTVISEMVEHKLPKLETLSLDSCGHNPAYHVGDALIIRSKSLKKLLLENYCWHVRFALNCPKLELYRCKGFMSHPSQPGQRPDRIWLQQLVVPECADLVPRSCRAEVIHVCRSGPPMPFRLHQLLGPHVELML